jgi:hypothetical protein
MKLALVALGLVVGFCSLTHAQNSDVHVKLTLAKDSFRIGEPIELIMEFTADGPGYAVDTIPDRKQITTDLINISPDIGVFHWLEDFNRNARHGRDVSMSQTLTSTPTRVPIVLNDSLRFDRPGTYTVSVTTRRLLTESPRQALTTNEVSFNVRAMTESDEASEVKRIAALLDAKRDLNTDENVTQQLSFLTGVASTREKVRRFIDQENRSGNYSAHIMYGLYIARDRGLVLSLLENAIRDPAIPVSWSLLGAVSSVRYLRENAASSRPGESDIDSTPTKRANQIKDSYITEIASGLSKRSGTSLTTTAKTILMSMRKENGSTGPIEAEVRRILIQNFDSFHEFDREYLLDRQWEQLRDPSLVPSLKKLLAYSGPSTKNVYDTALLRLTELSEADARPFIVREIRDPRSLINLSVLTGLKDESLPEVDGDLLAQIRTLASSAKVQDRLFLKQKGSLAARYATSGIYQELLEIYRLNGNKIDPESRGTLLAYLAKHNEAEAVPLIEKSLEQVEPEQVYSVLGSLTSLHYSDGIRDVLKKQLQLESPSQASQAAYLISIHGKAEDQSLLLERLARWNETWRSRAAEANNNSQGSVERELVLGLISSKAWKLLPEKVSELRASCVSEQCRQSVSRL